VAGQVSCAHRQLPGGGAVRSTAATAALLPPKIALQAPKRRRRRSPPCCSPALQAAQGAASSVGQWWESRGADQLKQSGEDSLAALKVGGHLHWAGILRRAQHFFLGWAALYVPCNCASISTLPSSPLPISAGMAGDAGAGAGGGGQRAGASNGGAAAKPGGSCRGGWQRHRRCGQAPFVADCIAVQCSAVRVRSGERPLRP
jgi:hypothetical protein